jgi:hypothetical protein
LRLGQHRPLRPARGARGVEQRRQIVGLAADGAKVSGCAAASASKLPDPSAQRFEPRAVTRRDRGERRERAGIAEKKLRAAVAQEIGHLLGV